MCVNSFTEFSVAGLMSPFEITAGPAGDNNLYVTDISSSAIFRVNLQGTVSRLTTAVPIVGITQSIGIGPDRNIWFSEGGNSVDRLTTGGTLTRFPTTHPVGGQTITGGPDGNIWFTEYGSNFIGRVTLASAQVDEFPSPTGSNPFGLAVASDGGLWATVRSPDQVVKLSVSGSALVATLRIPLATNSAPGQLIRGPGGNLWFTEFGSGKVAFITAAGALTESVSLAGDPGPDGLAYDSARNSLWFAEFNANKIGRLTFSGTSTASVLSEFSVPTPNSNVVFVAVGPDGNIWFTEENSRQIGRFVP